ncbi:hypothetical protein RKD46_003703 [Streptomyces pseudovenezuelae]
MVVGGIERCAQDDDPSARGDRAHDRVQGRVDLREPLDVPDPGGVEEDRGGGVRRGRELRPGQLRLARRELEHPALEPRGLR